MTGLANLEQDRLLTPRQAADFLAVAPATLRWWRWPRCVNAGPPFIRFSRRGHVRYSLADLQEWVDARRVKAKSEDVRLSEVWKAIRSETAVAEISRAEVPGCRAQGAQPRSEAESGIG